MVGAGVGIAVGVVVGGGVAVDTQSQSQSRGRVRILELLSSPVWTGPAEPMASVALALRRRGHQVEAAVDAVRPGDLAARLRAQVARARLAGPGQGC